MNQTNLQQQQQQQGLEDPRPGPQPRTPAAPLCSADQSDGLAGILCPGPADSLANTLLELAVLLLCFCYFQNLPLNFKQTKEPTLHIERQTGLRLRRTERLRLLFSLGSTALLETHSLKSNTNQVFGGSLKVGRRREGCVSYRGTVKSIPGRFSPMWTFGTCLATHHGSKNTSYSQRGKR